MNMSVSTYQCEPCSLERGAPVRALVRMVPVAVVMNDEMVGEEFYCCPHCFQPKFSAKTRKKFVAKPKASKKPTKAILSLVE